jgi:hypothetical protein
VTGRDRDGGELQLSPGASGVRSTESAFARYQHAPQPHKWTRFRSNGRQIRVKGQPHGVLLALLAAGNRGIARAEVQPWASNLSDSIASLERKSLTIDRRRGRPFRYVLRSPLIRIEDRP